MQLNDVAGADHNKTRRSRFSTRAILLRSLSAAIGIVIAILLVEVAMWALDVDPMRSLAKRRLARVDVTPTLSYTCYPSNPNREFQRLPDTRNGRWLFGTFNEPPTMLPLESLKETPWCVEYRLSTLGLRDQEYSPEPFPEVVRMLMMGDSFVFGEGVPIEETLGRQIQRLLGPRFELINGGTSGWNTNDEVKAIEQLVPATHAERVIWVFTANDIEQTPQLAARQAYINDLINIRDERLAAEEASAWYMGHSRLLRYVGHQFSMRQIARETIAWYQDLYDPAQNKVNLDRLGSQFKLVAERNDCKTVLVLYPLLVNLESDYPLIGVHERVAKLGQEAGLPVLDLATAFAGQKTGSMWVHEADHHPNGTANDIAARAIVRWLRQENAEFLRTADDRLN